MSPRSAGLLKKSPVIMLAGAKLCIFKIFLIFIGARNPKTDLFADSINNLHSF